MHLANAVGQRDTADPGHDDISEQDVDRVLTRKRERSLLRLGSDHSIARVAQHADGQCPQ